MLRTDNFEAFIAHARRYPGLWRMFFAILTGFGVFLVGTMAVVYSLTGLFGLDGGTSADLVAALESGETPQHMAIVLATFIPMALGALAMAAWHRRGLASLLGPIHRVLPDFLKGAGVIVALTAGYFIIDFALGPTQLILHVDVTMWLGFLVWAVPLLFIQITAEELVFRGYLQQQLAARFNSFVWWMILPSLVFAAGHYNSNIDPKLAIMFVFATFMFGVIAADLTRITGNLGAAMGLHFANNFFSILVIGVPGQLSGIALFHTPYRLDDADLVIGFLAIDIAMLVLIWLIGRRVLR